MIAPKNSSGDPSDVFAASSWASSCSLATVEAASSFLSDSADSSAFALSSSWSSFCLTFSFARSISFCNCSSRSLEAASFFFSSSSRCLISSRSSCSFLIFASSSSRIRSLSSCSRRIGSRNSSCKNMQSVSCTFWKVNRGLFKIAYINFLLLTQPELKNFNQMLLTMDMHSGCSLAFHPAIPCFRSMCLFIVSLSRKWPQ